MNILFKILKWAVLTLVIPSLGLVILFFGALLGHCIKALVGVAIWLAGAVFQIAVVVGFFLLVAYMANKGWIVI